MQAKFFYYIQSMWKYKSQDTLFIGDSALEGKSERRGDNGKRPSRNKPNLVCRPS